MVTAWIVEFTDRNKKSELSFCPQELSKLSHRTFLLFFYRIKFLTLRDRYDPFDSETT